MRLVGVELPGTVTGGPPAFIPMGRISVLFGANDTGKSHVLRALSRTLGSSADSSFDQWPTMFFELDDTPSSWIDDVYSSAGWFNRPDLLERLELFGRPLPSAGTETWQATSARIAMEGVGGPVEWYIKALRRLARLEDGDWDPLFVALAGSPVISAQPVRLKGRQGWSLGWCIPADAVAHPTTRVHLERLLGPIAPPAHRPLSVAPLVPWLTDRRGLPEALNVPTSDRELADAFAETVGAASAAMATLPKETADAFLGATLHPLIAARLPEFAKKHYEIVVALDPFATVRFLRDDGRQALAPGDMADGYRLWIELALRDAAATALHAVEQLAAIGRYAAELPLRRREAAHAHVALEQYGRDPLVFIAAGPDTAARLLGPLMADLAADHAAALAYSYPTTANRDSPLSVGARSHVHPPALFLIDEPERHLHARLQRSAAIHLRAVAVEGTMHAQLLLVTHSVAMLGLEGDIQFSHVSRDGGCTATAGFSPDDTAALSLMCDDLGLDRGELLSLYRVLAFVEGRVDEVVFNTLYGDRLRSAGIKVIPMHGTSRLGALPEADLLFSELRQAIAVVVDAVVDAQIPSADDRTELERLANSRKTRPEELKKVAQLRLAALEHNRQIEIRSVEVPDIIAALDGEVLGEVQRLPYPGHEATIRRWRAALSADPNASWKNLCVREGELDPSPEAIAPVAREMKRLGLGAPCVERVVQELERLAGRLD